MAESRLREWVRNYLAQAAKLPPQQVSFVGTLADFGLDSVDAVLMAGDLEETFKLEVDPASFLQFDTFEEMICALEQQLD